MVVFGQNLCLFVLIVQGVWSLVVFPQWTLFGHLDSTVSSAAKQEDSMIAQEYSWQRLRAHKNGLPRCVQEQNQCRQIGIIGAGEDCFLKRLRMRATLLHKI